MDREFCLEDWCSKNGSIWCKMHGAELVKIGFEKACAVILEEAKKNASTPLKLSTTPVVLLESLEQIIAKRMEAI